MTGIILASKSAARISMLENVGLKFRSIPAGIDEEAIIKNSDLDIKSITEKLAAMKAIYISKKNPDKMIIGSDQTLEFKGKLISKSKTLEEAKDKLKQLRGRAHNLHSAVCVVLNGNIIFSDIDTATLNMHNFDDSFLNEYMDKNHDALINCVGGYKIEGTGAWLFSSVKGDFFTIMGMPLLPLLGFLRDA